MRGGGIGGGGGGLGGRRYGRRGRGGVRLLFLFLCSFRLLLTGITGPLRC
jgi:hypothetical protein